MKYLATLILIIPLSCNAGGMNSTDMVLEGIWQGINVLDLGTTLNIEDHKHKHELNPILGKYPSREKVYAYFAIGAVSHAAITYLLAEHAEIMGVDIHPKKLWNIVTITFSAGCVINNFAVGLKLDF